jgi:hypothetical protein
MDISMLPRRTLAWNLGKDTNVISEVLIKRHIHLFL